MSDIRSAADAKSTADQTKEDQKNAQELHDALDDIAVQADAGNVQGVKDLADRVRGKVAGAFPRPTPKQAFKNSPEGEEKTQTAQAQQTSQGQASTR